jgi:hypothetical protein
MRFYTWFFAFSLLQKYGMAQSFCGKPTDPCMNEENWQRCLDLHADGCETVLSMESCPLQFVCAGGSLDAKADNPEAKTTAEPVPDACVSLYVYAEERCQGKPLRVMSFPTWTSPGSKCCKLRNVVPVQYPLPPLSLNF